VTDPALEDGSLILDRSDRVWTVTHDWAACASLDGCASMSIATLEGAYGPLLAIPRDRVREVFDRSQPTPPTPPEQATSTPHGSR
jgi:hypothetical protein